MNPAFVLPLRNERAARARVFLPFATLALLAACAAPVDRDRDPRSTLSAQSFEAQRPVDIEHYALDIDLQPATRSIEASCTLSLQARERDITSLELDFVGLATSAVATGAGQPLGFTQRDGKLAIQFVEPLRAGQSAEIRVQYAGQPAKGLWFAGERNGVPTQVFTQGECQDARWWFPCIDEPWERATSEVIVRMPLGWTSVAAGERVEHAESNGRALDHWKMDFAHPAYLETLVAGQFAEQRSAWNGIPLQFLVPPERADAIERSFAETDDVLAFFSDLTGVRYPYAKYAQVAVENFPFGGMENISATTLTDLALVDERALPDGGMEGLVAHEAAHQWFGDSMTCADWSHVWLNEGFATYLTQLYYESTRGADEYRVRMRDTQAGYVAADVGQDRRPTVHAEYREPMDLFFRGGQTYGGAACRLHLLRFVLGDQHFFQGLRTYTAENQGRSVTTGVFRRAMEKVSGQDLGWFFEQWFYQGGYPEFAVHWDFDAGRQLLRLDVRQEQQVDRWTPAAFRTPVLVEVRDESGPRVHKLSIDRRTQRFELPCSARPLYVRFDKGSWIPKRLRYDAPAGEWLALLRNDDDPNGRRDAARELGERLAGSVDSKLRQIAIDELVHHLRSDSVAAVRASCAAALGRAGGAIARQELEVAASGAEQASVRVAALNTLCALGRDSELASFARTQYERGFSWETMAAAARLVASSDPDEAYAWVSRELQRAQTPDRLRADLIGVLASLPGDAVPEQLARWALDAQAGPRTRVNAVAELGRRANAQPWVVDCLAPLLQSSEYRLRGAAIQALAAQSNGESRSVLKAYYKRSTDSRERRVIEAALKSAP